MGVREEIETTFSELKRIEDEAIRTGVVDAWELAASENDIEDPNSFPWFGPYQEALGLGDEMLVDHVRDVTAAAIGLAEGLASRRSVALDMDVVIAGALLHDVSHFGEFDGTRWSERGRLLGHPYYGLYVVWHANLPVELEHIVLSHTPHTVVKPATIEAEVVSQADAATVNAIRSRAVDDLREAPSAGLFD